MYFFFFNDTATTEIYTLSLHDALPISLARIQRGVARGHEGEERCHRARRVQVVVERLRELPVQPLGGLGEGGRIGRDRKSTRLNSSHANISYAVFCLKKKKINQHHHRL